MDRKFLLRTTLVLLICLLLTGCGVSKKTQRNDDRVKDMLESLETEAIGHKKSQEKNLMEESEEETIPVDENGQVRGTDENVYWEFPNIYVHGMKYLADPRYKIFPKVKDKLNDEYIRNHKYDEATDTWTEAPGEGVVMFEDDMQWRSGTLYKGDTLLYEDIPLDYIEGLDINDEFIEENYWDSDMYCWVPYEMDYEQLAEDYDKFKKIYDNVVSEGSGAVITYGDVAEFNVPTGWYCDGDNEAATQLIDWSFADTFGSFVRLYNTIKNADSENMVYVQYDEFLKPDAIHEDDAIMADISPVIYDQDPEEKGITTINVFKDSNGEPHVSIWMQTYDIHDRQEQSWYMNFYYNGGNYIDKDTWMSMLETVRSQLDIERELSYDVFESWMRMAAEL